MFRQQKCNIFERKTMPILRDGYFNFYFGLYCLDEGHNLAADGYLRLKL